MSPLKVFLTRPEGRNGSVPRRLREQGMVVSELPALALRPLAAPEPLPPPGHYDVVVFVSRYAVQCYVELLRAGGGPSWAWPVQTIAATVGASSAQALLQAGITASSIVHPPVDAPAQDSEALLAVLEARRVAMKRVLIVRGTQGREWLAGELKQRGIRVDFLPIYERMPAAWPATTFNHLVQALQHPHECVFLLTSSEGVRAMAGRLQEAGLLHAWSRAVFIVIHERIGATLQSVLASHDADVPRLASCLPDDDSIVQAICAVAGPTA